MEGNGLWTLRFIQRNRRECSIEVKKTEYTSLVCPSLEYTSSSGIRTQLDSQHIEQVQQKATRSAYNNYTDRSPGCVFNMLHDLGWEPLEDRRRHHRLSMLYKIKHGIVNIDASDVLRPSDKCTRSGQRLYQPYAASQVYKRSFYPYTIQKWNRLSTAVADATSLESFQALQSSSPPGLLSSIPAHPTRHHQMHIVLTCKIEDF